MVLNDFFKTNHSYLCFVSVISVLSVVIVRVLTNHDSLR